MVAVGRTALPFVWAASIMIPTVDWHTDDVDHSRALPAPVESLVT